MTPTVQITNVCEFMRRHLVDVFETMLSLKAVDLPQAAVPLHGQRVTGAVGFAGETTNGTVYLHLSAAFANRAAAAMLGLPAEEALGDNEVNDVIGEATNMLTGGLKSWLCDCGADCAVSTPTIIRGESYSIEAVPEVKREFLIFECEGERLAVEIHIKFI
jgi:CheY-specific phosphatase CheX